VRAALLTTLPAERLEVGEVPDVVPRPGQLLVDVSACAICGTDLHILEGRSYRPDLPFVLGHEPVGRVVAAGSPGDTQWVGRRITISLFVGDGACAWCRAGDERLCPSLVSITGVLRSWGGFAEQLLVDVSQVVSLPDTLVDRDAATLVDAGATAANCVRSAGDAGGPAVVVGGGPLGFLAAELLRIGGRAPVVVEPNATRRKAIEVLGHHAVADVSAVTDVPTLVIDAAADPAVVAWGLRALAPQGWYVVAGYAMVESLDFATIARKELVVRGVRSGRRDDLERIVGLAAGGAIRVPTVTGWPLDGINEAIAALRAGDVAGKAVIDVAA
jgi:propanol-preferring alcohol dehydrogenase